METTGQDNPGFYSEDKTEKVQHQNLKNDRSGDGVVEITDIDKLDCTETDSDLYFEDKEHEGDFIGKLIEKFWSTVRSVLSKHKSTVKPLLLTSLFLLYNSYLIASLHYGITKRTCLDFCEDVGFLFIITVIVYIGLIYFFIIKPLYNRILNTEQGIRFRKSILQPIEVNCQRFLEHRFSSIILSSLFIITLKIFIFYDTRHDPERLVSYLGFWVLVLLGLIFSKHPGFVVWRHVLWGLGLQFLMGLIILRWSFGKAVFDCIGKKVKIFLDYTDVGSGFVFGYLVTQKPFYPSALNVSISQSVTEDINNSSGIGFVFMFKILSIIYFFNFMVSILFYLGTMNWIVSKMGWFLQMTIGTTACESMNAAGNIFLGQTEAPLLIRPFLPQMTKSEIHAVMTGGFATIAGSVLAAYISFGIDASHLLSASVMSAPAALAFSKLFYPETKKSKTTADSLPELKSEDSNVLDAAVNGATQSVFLVGNIAASLIAFLAFIAFVNGVLGWLGGLVAFPCLSFEWILGWIFYPLALVMGVPCGSRSPEDNSTLVDDNNFCAKEVDLMYEDECKLVGVLVGLKTVVNEFVAYDKLSQLRPFLSYRSIAISTYALCGFSNPASIGVQIGALSFMAPKRRGHIAEVAIRAFVAGSVACFLTACVAGTLIIDPDKYEKVYGERYFQSSISRNCSYIIVQS